MQVTSHQAWVCAGSSALTESLRTHAEKSMLALPAYRRASSGAWKGHKLLQVIKLVSSDAEAEMSPHCGYYCIAVQFSF